jgi:glucose/arabinose dehydrogenase
MRPAFPLRTPFPLHAPCLLLLATCLALSLILPVHAAGVPAGFTDTQVAAGLTSPTAMTILPDGRILLIQQNGVLRLIKNDVLLPASFHEVRNVDSFAERGCLGITADPDFAVNHLVYLYCTVTDGTNSFNRILRITEANDSAVPDSEQVLLTLPNVPPGTQWHMGGALRFGIDGKLYVAVGGHEDTRLTEQSSNSQKLSSPFGKILRINADGSIPPDNPFANTPGAHPAVFNLGFRNPFTIDIEPGTGQMYINDVGAGSWEEIDAGLPGANYGWPATEGDASDPRFTNPVHVYSHAEGCAITGGAFYNPPSAQFPAAYVGKYFFADFCSGEIRFIDPAALAASIEFATDISNPVNLAVALDGSLYYIARNQETGAAATAAGTVGKISFTNAQTPRITQHPQSQTVFLGDPVTLSVKADAADSVRWQRNGADIAGAAGASYTLPAVSAADNQAAFRAVAHNVFGDTPSNPALLTITTDRLPNAVITSPAADSRYVPGTQLAYRGAATDPEDGTLPPAAYTWRADFMHDTHSHPFMEARSGASSGSLSVPVFEAEAANTWLRLYLTVKDAQGQTHTVTRDIYPATQIADMVPATALNGVGPIEKNMSNGVAGAGDGGVITLGRIPYAKGLGVHAPSDIGYSLGGACSGNFVSDVGVDDSAGARGSVVFQVWLDGALVFDSGFMHGGDLRKSINVSVAGKSELRLRVTDGGDGNAFDIADWAGARVTGCPSFAAAVFGEGN